LDRYAGEDLLLSLDMPDRLASVVGWEEEIAGVRGGDGLEKDECFL
jgi:hypothetical protein